MSADYQNEIEQLLEEAYNYDHGPQEIEVLERAIRIADTHQDAQYGFDIRKRLMQAATFGGAPEKALVAFTWCIGQCDRSPEEFDSGELLWEYKWVVSGLKHFPQISREQIEHSFEDMTRRYEQHGLSMRPIYKLRAMFGIHRGDLEETRKWQRLWRVTDQGFGNDCAACELHDQVEFLTFVGKDERAIEMASPIINNQMRCAEIPHLTYAMLLNSYLTLGELKAAYSAHVRGYRMIESNREFLSSVSDHMIYLSLTGNHTRNIPMLEKHLGWAIETNSMTRRYDFYRAALFACQEMLEAGQSEIEANLPIDFELYTREHRYSTKQLADWFDGEARRIAGLFDRRNDSDYFTRRIDELPQLRKIARPYPIED